MARMPDKESAINYYKRHIGDYAKKTGRLTMLEHGAYTLLLDACYDRERFPTEREAIEWSWARTDDEIAAVRFVLARFFDLKDGIYVQRRCADELVEYADKAQLNSRIATEREEKRREKARTSTERARSVQERAPIVHEPPPNHKPLTNNQEPLTKEQERVLEIPTSEIQPENIKAVLAMKAAGIFSTTPNNPELLAALDEGVTPELLGEVASKNPGKPQLYVVRAALGQLRDCKKNGARFGARAAIRAPPALPTEDEHRAAAQPLPDWVLEIQNADEGEADVENI